MLWNSVNSHIPMEKCHGFLAKRTQHPVPRRFTCKPRLPGHLREVQAGPKAWRTAALLQDVKTLWDMIFLMSLPERNLINLDLIWWSTKKNLVNLDIVWYDCIWLYVVCLSDPFFCWLMYIVITCIVLSGTTYGWSLRRKSHLESICSLQRSYPKNKHDCLGGSPQELQVLFAPLGSWSWSELPYC